MGEKVNASELARRLGVSEGAVRKHVARGLYKAGKDGKFDADECKAIWQASRDPDAVLRGIAGGAAVSKQPAQEAAVPLPEGNLAKVRTAQGIVKLQREQLELSRAKGELIRKEDAMRAAMAVVSLVCERLDGAAAMIGARVTGLDAAGATRVAAEIIAQIRTEISKLGDSVYVVGSARD